ncbi:MULTISPECIES: DUF6717 family protein [unclassified Chelatococcus]|uniref:DUF6717 family protein n=1 Tax=unclassified Chelatococcus TaxID=2638111 RepID=UPI001BD10E33|nr:MULTISPECIES: DUF6717 family protein [unclassified Chelatococcus]MBS7695643.1 hypothetical protein [Chelatococcus sp. YT9]MBX3557964.1 hypothetical protein [Chelatococcus sp.]
MNSINVIAPYKHLGMWVFDDAAVGLKQEPFVAGADSLIDFASASIPDAGRGFVMVFSAAAFPGHQYTLEWRRAEGDGNVYYSREFQQEGWLCPALLRYFDSPPAMIHVQIKERERATRSRSFLGNWAARWLS